MAELFWAKQTPTSKMWDVIEISILDDKVAETGSSTTSLSPSLSLPITHTLCFPGFLVLPMLFPIPTACGFIQYRVFVWEYMCVHSWLVCSHVSYTRYCSNSMSVRVLCVCPCIHCVCVFVPAQLVCACPRGTYVWWDSFSHTADGLITQVCGVHGQRE